LFAASVLLSACQTEKPAAPPPLAGFITIHEQSVALKAELPGRTSPFAVSQVRPQISGIVKARLFTEGSAVKVGQPLYQIDPAPYRASYESAAATLAGA
jgi:membrane fusion protein (multidrug efflux system)